MRIKFVVGALVLALAVYFWLLAERALALIGGGGFAGIALGVGVVLLPVIGVVVVVFELRFGRRTQVLAQRLAAAGESAGEPDLPRRPSGRVDRDAADAHFETVRADVEAARADWRGWYRLARAYDLAGDRHRARGAMRHAIELARGEPGVS